jgi:hypothetical protein
MILVTVAGYPLGPGFPAMRSPIRYGAGNLMMPLIRREFVQPRPGSGSQGEWGKVPEAMPNGDQRHLGATGAGFLAIADQQASAILRARRPRTITFIYIG